MKSCQMNDKVGMSKEQGRPSDRENSIGKGPEIVNTGLSVVSRYAVVRTWNKGSGGT